MGRVTIYSLAKDLGVSASTVSRAFSRPELVSAEVREQVLSTAARHGYRPNRTARGLVTGRTDAIGLFVPDITNPFMPPLVRSIQQAAQERELSLILVDGAETPAAEEGLMIKVASLVDGMIITSPRGPDAAIRRVASIVPAVLINRRVARVPAVVCDNTPALHAAGDRLTELGHRQVALLPGPADSWAARQRTQALRDWATGAGVQLTELPTSGSTYEAGRAGAPHLVATPATAVFAFDDVVAAGLVSGLVESGRRVPEDVSVVGCDDVLLARVLTPQLTTMTAPLAEIAATALHLLDQALAGHRAQTVHHAAAFTPRGSIGPAHPTPVRTTRASSRRR